MRGKGITRLETMVQELVEGSFGRLLGGQLAPEDVAARLVWAIEDSLHNGQVAAAYDVLLNPADLALLGQQEGLADVLAQASWDLGRQAGLPVTSRPLIVLQSDESVRRHTVQIAARNSAASVNEDPLAATQMVGQLAGPVGQQSLQALHDLDAFLIIQGRRHYPLRKPVVTIGRRADNDIVIDLSTVSRLHAQVRWRFGRFILYDVSNRGRTSVNSVPVTEHVLRPGDVIALSEALLIYAEGESLSANDPNDVDEGTKTRPRTIPDDK